MFSHIAQSGIYRWCLSFFSGLSTQQVFTARRSSAISEPNFQPNNLTKTAVLLVLSDLSGGVNSGDVAALVLVFVPAFNTILCRHLELSFGLHVCTVPVLVCFGSYSQWCQQGGGGGWEQPC